jgi:solute carrier family 25 phosphate transporter 23/24/25/41
MFYFLSQDRMTINHEAYPSIAVAFNKIYRADGISGLYAGLCPTLVGMLPYSTCYYFMYETMKTSYCHAHKKKSLSRSELLVIGALSGQDSVPPKTLLLFNPLFVMCNKLPIILEE